MIQHNEYFTGSVQSLRATSRKGLEFTVGIIEPGDYDFGTASRTEEIQVILGVLEINGTPVFGPTNVFVIPKGGAINIRADDTAAYVCRYR